MSWDVEYTDEFGEWWSGLAEAEQEDISAIAEIKAEMALAELRQARERSQEELARVLKVNQPAVAKLEKRTDMYVSNLRRYVEALGGKLEITARFPEASVTIANFGELGKRTRKSREAKPARGLRS